MPGRYRKGASFENLVKDILTEDGWVAIRSAGSHGIIDVIGIKVDEKWFIQCRTNGNLSQEEREALIDLANKHKARPILAYEAVVDVSLDNKLKVVKKKSVIFEEVKLLKPNFHYEVIGGRFVKVND